MGHGKDVCKYLKEVRQRIAEENGIPLKTEKCTYEGECIGTCPHCEAEVRYLEKALAERMSLGKVATVAGLALGLATTTLQAQNIIKVTPSDQDTSATHKIIGTGTLKGMVTDSKTQEPLAFCQVVLKQGDKAITTAYTDFDGIYTIKSVPLGEYTVEIKTTGFEPFIGEVKIDNEGFNILSVSLGYNTTGLVPLQMIGIIDGERDPMPANPPNQQMEIDGVKVISR
ncbi:MAG: carboxypeptidase regulatory-like domain-containing protein [Bacteroidales bacterium]|nr:carboxypeptidase regulatory-like domain-containing protein [Bacteroidales bacterium]